MSKLFCIVSVLYMSVPERTEKTKKQTKQKRMDKYMKKIFALILALALMIPAFAETATSTEAEIEYFTLEGIVTDVTEEFFLLDTMEQGEIQVNYDENTYFSNEIPFAAGQYAYVTYNGQMTRSLPAQVYAIAVNVSLLTGEITEIDLENNALHILNDLHGLVIVHLPETDSAENYEVGSLIGVYHTGAMMMSLPPQIGAGLIINLYTLAGTVTEITENTVLFESDSVPYQINLTEATAITGELTVGASITVLFNGMMTRSLPAQITAMEITVNTEAE